MVPDESTPEVRRAIEELRLYLSDILPPLLVADTFQLLLEYSPSLMASIIQGWTASQRRRGSEITVSDYIYYAVKKIFLIGEFRLVPREPFERFLEELKGLVLLLCPEQERQTLKENLKRLVGSADALATPRDMGALIRRKGADRAPAVSSEQAFSSGELQGLRRFSLLLARLGEQIRSPRGSGPGASSDPLLSQALTAAARGARDSRELELHLGRLRELGMWIETGEIIRALGSSLPGWVLPEPRPEKTEPLPDAGKAPPLPPAPESASESALHRIVAHAEDPAEVARRFNEMVLAAVERFNEGALPQAVTMLELADRIAAEKGLDAGSVENVKNKADEALDIESFRKYTDVQAHHALLRRVLNFFPARRPQSLIAELQREMKRERRKLILQLLEIHGTPARQAALQRLLSAFEKGEGDEKWYFRRNLLYLLRRIPPDDGCAPSEEDVEAAVRHAVLGFRAPLVKEAVANLGQSKRRRAEDALLSLLADLERMLEKPAQATYDTREVRLLLDRVVTALARIGTTRTRRAVVEHILKKKGELGDPMARLSELAGQDLSGDTELVERLLAALKANSPRTLLGVPLYANDSNAKHIIEALSTTPAPSVRTAFENLAKRFPDLDSGRAASRALSSLGEVPQAPQGTRSGVLEPFGLPALMQDLTESGLSGSLTLKDSKGGVAAEIVLQAGRLRSCETQGLSGEEAFYQVLERPAGGTFLFEGHPLQARDDVTTESLPGILPLCLEGMRRYDELQQAAALVPDDVKLGPTNVRPKHHPDELDGIFVNGLWRLASGGATPRQCEGTLTVDAYRIRRQLSYWVEIGALAAG